MMASNISPNRYFPPPFSDPELNTALQTAFTLIYGCVASSKGLVLDSASSLVTGSLKNIQTALTSVTNVVAGFDTDDQGINEYVSARPSPVGKGQIDIFVWKPTANNDVTPIASTTQRRIRWIVTGPQSQ